MLPQTGLWKERIMKCRIVIVWVVVSLASLAAAQTFAERPTAYSSTGTPFMYPANAYDGNLGTAAVANAARVGKGMVTDKETWYGFPVKPSGSNGMQLHIDSAVTMLVEGCISGPNECTASLQYSLNGGQSWIGVYFVENTSRALQTDVIPLSDSQDLTQVQVRAIAYAAETCDSLVDPTDCPPGSGRNTVRTTQQVFEIWITGND